jgi:hypothetical protein
MTNEERRSSFNRRTSNSRVWSGLILLFGGAALLLQKMGTVFPYWVFSWPMILIGIGFLGGVRRKFHGSVWIVMILIGGFFLLDMIYPEIGAKKYTGPILLIALGITFILRPRQHPFCDKWGRWDNNDTTSPPPNSDRYDKTYTKADDYLDIVSILGGTKKNIVSKDFKGGEVTSILGGTELNLMQADIQGRVVMELTQVLGGAKLIVPGHWDVKPELVSVFGNIEDKRQITGPIDPNKILILKGTSFLGGIEIRSY